MADLSAKSILGINSLLLLLVSSVFALNTQLVRATGTGYTQPPGLVGYWKFDEGSGISALDSSLNGNNGVLIGSPTWTTGKSGYALTFNGTNYVDCGNAASLHVQSYTLAAWIKPSAINDSEHRIISNGGYGNTNGAVDFVIAADGRLVVLNQNGYQDECWSQSGSLLAIGTWSFVAATYNATNGNVKLYVNGAEVSTTLNTLRVPNPSPSYNMHIGVMGGPLTMYFKGSIDEVRVYNRSLTPAEITQVVNESPPDYWPMFQHDLTHSGTSTSKGSTTNNTLWVYATGGAVISSAAVVGGFVYVGTLDGKIYCLNAAKGSFVWSYTASAPFYSSPAVIDGRVYVGSGDQNTYGNMYCLNATTGTLIWSYPTASFDQRFGGVISSPAVVGGLVYFGCDNGILYCLNATTGISLWGIPITLGYIISSPAIVGGLVYVGATDGLLYCRNATNGNPVWSYQTGGGVFSSPAVVSGKLYVGSVDYKIYCLNATTGAHIWNYTTGGYVDSSPAVAGGFVYVGSQDWKVYCLNAATGAFVWSYKTGDVEWACSPAVASGLVYIGSNDTKVYCLDATTGLPVWSYKTGGASGHNPAVVDAVYVGSTDGHVYAFGEPLAVAISPSSASIDTYQSQLFTSNVTSGVSPYSYQWFLNNAPVQGATSSSWTFIPSSPGSYTVYVNVTDDYGASAKSNGATVTVNPPLSVSASPASVTVDMGQLCQFNGTVSGGTQPYSYQWYLNETSVSGASGASWTYASSSAGSFNVYVNVTDGAGFTAKSNIASVTVNQLPSVAISPASATMDVGQSKQFTSAASNGSSPYTYQWYLNGTSIGGATSSTYAFTPTSPGHYNIYANATDNVGAAATSNTAAVTVNNAPSVTMSPTSVTMDFGQSQLFNSSVTGGASPYTYQWYLNGAPVSGAASNSWTFTPTSGSYTIYLKITDNVGGTAISPTANVTVNPVIPEFQPPFFALLFIIATLMTAFVFKRKRNVKHN